MNSNRRGLILALVVLIGAGILRMPVEQSLTEGLRDRGLLRPPVELEVRKKIGQTFWAVSLGGLRTFVATMLNLRAFSYFESLQWPQLADTYETIVRLAPHSGYYWDTGSWHMATNAASFYKRATELPELRRRSEWQRWIERGTAFLEEGVRLNPDDWRLWAELGRIYSDPFKLPDYEKAAVAYDRAAASGEALPYIERAAAFSRARIPGRQEAALPEIRRIQQEGRGKIPRANALLFVLEHRADPDRDLLPLALEIFPDKPTAYRQLADYYLDVRHNFPVDGLPEILRRLESDLDIPEERSVLPLRRQLLLDSPEPWQP